VEFDHGGCLSAMLVWPLRAKLPVSRIFYLTLQNAGQEPGLFLDGRDPVQCHSKCYHRFPVPFHKKGAMGKKTSKRMVRVVGYGDELALD
jgi:hypothetical protein